MLIELLTNRSWQPILAPFLNSSSGSAIEDCLIREIKQNNIICPQLENLFSAFNLTSLDNLKVVIIGQDPYHGIGQANGLAFSVNRGVAIPPSLNNIYKELQANDVGFTMPHHGDLTAWAKQGILLLNTSLSVRLNQPNSHYFFNWHQFTDYIIQTINEEKQNIVFLLWGKLAQQKQILIDKDKHLILQSSHPSPLSAHRGFLGCQHFKRVNQYLKSHGIKEIAWQI